MTRRRWVALSIALFAGLAWSAAHFGNSIALLFESSRPSESHGTTDGGRLVNGKRLPTSGPNFEAYSRLGATLGRNTVHGAVRDVVLAAYERLHAAGVSHRFVYGETGWPRGGSFPPHRTHQNGLSVDFMVPLLDGSGAPVKFPTSAASKFGYELDFDEAGRRGDLRIDFDAVSSHLLALDAAAKEAGIAIRRIIFTSEYRGRLLHPGTGASLEENLPFMPGGAWVRHDEHYHVDFSLQP